MARKKNLRPYQDEWVKAYDEGMSLRVIAQQYQVDRSSVARLVKEKRDIRPNSIPVEKIQQMGEWYALGLGKTEIAQRLEISTSTVGKWLEREHGIEIEVRNRPFENLIPEMKTRYEAGETLQEIGDALGISRAAVHTYLQRAGIERRSYQETSRQYDFKEDYFETLDNARSFSLGVLWGCANYYEDALRGFLSLRFNEILIPFILDWMSDFTTPDISRFNPLGNPENQPNRQTTTYELRLHSNKWTHQLFTWGFNSHYPLVSTLQADEFWQGYVRVRGSAQKMRRYLYFGFESPEMRQSFLDYLAQHDITQSLREVSSRVSPHHCGIEVGHRHVIQLLFQRFPFLEEQARTIGGIWDDFKFQD